MLPSLDTFPADLTGWILLAPLGDHLHSEGQQRLDLKTARALAHNFASLWQKVQRRFGGLPIFIGHPDAPEFQGKPGHLDTKSYGWIAHLAARDDGLYMQAHWSEAGEALLRNGHYKYLSPRWLVEEGVDGYFYPLRLLSVGLTNFPVIAGEAISNELQQTRHERAEIIDILNLPASATTEDVLAELERLQAGEAHDTNPPQAWAHELAEAQADRVDTAMTAAQLGGWIRPGEEETTRQALAHGFAATWQQLKQSTSSLKTCVTATAIGQRERHPLQRWIEPVQDRMHATGEDFDTAWRTLKRHHA